GTGAVLVESRDQYMLNVCSAKEKYLIIELCNDILIDTFVLANYEFFSSMVRDFRLTISDRYPPRGGDDGWTDLGTFRAHNARDLQIFRV
ncbi:SUN domain-containing protein, partial [Piptocephalis cylindrospora]